MTGLSNFFYKVINKYYLIGALLLSCAFYTIVYSYNQEGLRLTGKPMRVLDTEVYYGVDRANEIISGYPPLVKQKVIFFARVYDTIFPVIYVTIFISAITLLMQRLVTGHSKWKLLNLLPILAGVADLLENAFIVILIQQHPNITEAMVQRAAIFTLLKWGLIIVCILIVIVQGALVWLRSKATAN